VEPKEKEAGTVVYFNAAALHTRQKHTRTWTEHSHPFYGLNLLFSFFLNDIIIHWCCSQQISKSARYRQWTDE